MSRVKRLLLAAAAVASLATLAGAIGAGTGGAVVQAETSRCYQVHICVID